MARDVTWPESILSATTPTHIFGSHAVWLLAASFDSDVRIDVQSGSQTMLTHLQFNGLQRGGCTPTV